MSLKRVRCSSVKSAPVNCVIGSSVIHAAGSDDVITRPATVPRQRRPNHAHRRLSRRATNIDNLLVYMQNAQVYNGVIVCAHWIRDFQSISIIEKKTHRIDSRLSICYVRGLDQQEGSKNGWQVGQVMISFSALATRVLDYCGSRVRLYHE